MAQHQDSKEDERKDVYLEDALEIVGEGFYTKYLCFVCGLTTLSTISCMQYLFYILPTVSCEFNLTPVQAAFLGSTTFIGTLITGYVAGFLVDHYGRKKFLQMITLAASICFLFASLSPNATILMILSLSAGVMLGGVFGMTYVYLSEFCSKNIRSQYITRSSLLASLSNTYSPCVAWVVMWLDVNVPITESFAFTSWRLYIILNALPMFTSALIFLKLPESPKFLLLKGRNTEALEVLSSLYSVNNKKALKEFSVESLRLDPEDEVRGLSKTNQNGLLKFITSLLKQMKDLFIPPYLLYTVICAFLMFSVVGFYCIVLLWLPQEASRILKYKTEYGELNITLCQLMSRSTGIQTVRNCHVDNETYIIISFVGIAFFTLSTVHVFLVKKFKVKFVLGFYLLIGSGILFLVMFSKSAFVILASLGTITALLGASQALLYSIIVDSFPTALRGTASSVTIFFGRASVPLGSSLVGAAFKTDCNIAYGVIAAILAVSSLISFLIPMKKKLFKEIQN